MKKTKILSFLSILPGSILDLKAKIIFRNKLSGIKRRTSLVDPDNLVKEVFRKKWRNLCKHPNADWLRVYSTISGIQSPDFVPEDIYYLYIEPVLNNRIYTMAYSDKNSYDRLMYQNKALFPKTYLRRVNNVFYDRNYSPVINLNDTTLRSHFNGITEFIIKPSSGSSGGERVERFHAKEDGVFRSISGETFTLEYLNCIYPENFIIQEAITQHNYFRRFNPDSVNTIRVLTYRSVISEIVIPVQSVLRIGRGNTIVDNQAAGGISCGIKNGGRLNSFAVDKYGNRYYRINGLEFARQDEVPYFTTVLSIAADMGKQFFYSRLNAMDFCIDNTNSVRLLEINTKNIEINFLQMNNGPLFDVYTDEIIDYCSRHKRVRSLTIIN